MLSKLKNFSTSDKNYLGRAEFKNLIMDNIVLISRSVSRKTKSQLLLKCFRKKIYFSPCDCRALRHQLIIPDFRGFTNIIELLFEQSRAVEEGKIPNYIPQLARSVSSI